jgi:predicted metal-dependent hydrolase
MIRDRRAFLSLAAGIGLGAVVAEIYERLYNIPVLERRFKSEVSYWMDEYNSAKEMVEKLSQQLNVSRDEISRLSGEVNDWKNRYNTAKEEVDRLSYIVNASDAFEKESTAAISFYRERMEEAIRRLKNTIDKYRAILGDERVSFESTTLKVLEDLKLTQEKLLKLLPYFPLIRNLSWRPSRVVNDKIYDLEVYLEVISPLNTLAEVEISLIPVEYEYFITRYGMRREDYAKVFPPEETKTVILKPAGLEKEIFTVEFGDIIGGREYLIRVVAKDVADNAKSDERKIHYIREFENLGRELYGKGIIVGASYMSGYYPWQTGKSPDDYPLLGKYDAVDEIVQWKHVDWAGYAGVNVFFIGAGAWEDWKIKGVEGNIMRGLMDKGIKCTFFWEPWGDYFVRETAPNAPEWSIDLTHPRNKDNFINQLYIISTSQLISHHNYFRVNGRPVIKLYDAAALIKETAAFTELKSKVKDDVLFYGDTTLKIPALPKDAVEWYFPLKDFSHYDWISTWVGFINAEVARKYSTNYDEWYYRMTSEWSKWVRSIGKSYVSSIVPGFKYIWEPEGIERKVDRLVNQLAYSLELTKIITFDTWNDFAENTFIEPSQREGFSYLDAVHRLFSKLL